MVSQLNEKAKHEYYTLSDAFKLKAEMKKY